MGFSLLSLRSVGLFSNSRRITGGMNLVVRFGSRCKSVWWVGGRSRGSGRSGSTGSFSFEALWLGVWAVASRRSWDGPIEVFETQSVERRLGCCCWSALSMQVAGCGVVHEPSEDAGSGYN